MTELELFRVTGMSFGWTRYTTPLSLEVKLCPMTGVSNENAKKTKMIDCAGKRIVVENIRIRLSG
jgi:hypothetical protein